MIFRAAGSDSQSGWGFGCRFLCFWYGLCYDVCDVGSMFLNIVTESKAKKNKGWTILWSKTKKQRIDHFMKQNEKAKDGPFYEANKTKTPSLLHKMVHPLFLFLLWGGGII